MIILPRWRFIAFKIIELGKVPATYFLDDIRLCPLSDVCWFIISWTTLLWEAWFLAPCSEAHSSHSHCCPQAVQHVVKQVNWWSSKCPVRICEGWDSSRALLGESYLLQVMGCAGPSLWAASKVQWKRIHWNKRKLGALKPTTSLLYLPIYIISHSKIRGISTISP